MVSKTNNSHPGGWDRATRIAVLSLVVALAALGVSFWQWKVAQRAEDRASGKIRANFEFIGIGNTDEKTLSRLEKKTQLGFKAVYLDDVDKLVNWGPYVEVKNTGEEVIDGIRIEVELTTGMYIGPGVTQKDPVPYVVTQASSFEPHLAEKLQPGASATVLIVKPLLEQILPAKFEEKNDLEYLGHFHVSVYCRIAGGTGYDRPTPDKTATLHFVWLPSGFPEEKCKKILAMQPTVRIIGK